MFFLRWHTVVRRQELLSEKEEASKVRHKWFGGVRQQSEGTDRGFQPLGGTRSPLRSAGAPRPRYARKMIMKKTILKSIQRVLLVIAAIAATVLFSGCDGYINVRGRIYGTNLTKSTDRSFAMVDTIDRVPPPQMIPIKGAEVVIEPWGPDESAKMTNAELWTLRGLTDESGYFELSMVAEPGKYPATLTVRQPGYQPLEHVFIHDRFKHQAIIILNSETIPEKMR